MLLRALRLAESPEPALLLAFLFSQVFAEELWLQCRCTTTAQCHYVSGSISRVATIVHWQEVGHTG